MYKRYDEDGKRRHWCRNVIPHVMCLLRIKIPLISLSLKTNSTSFIREELIKESKKKKRLISSGLLQCHSDGFIKGKKEKF